MNTTIEELIALINEAYQTYLKKNKYEDSSTTRYNYYATLYTICREDPFPEPTTHKLVMEYIEEVANNAYATASDESIDSFQR